MDSNLMPSGIQGDIYSKLQPGKSNGSTTPNLQPGLRYEWLVCLATSILVIVFALLYIGEGSLVLASLYGVVLAMTSGTVIVVPVQYLMRWRSHTPWRAGEPKTANILGYVERAFVFSLSLIHI